jgi:protease secretion system membrane fusion protein
MRKVVTHMTGGTIEAIHVTENQVVKADDVLISLESAKAQSAYDSIAQDYISAGSKMARLTAEQSLANEIEFPEELVRFAEENGRLDVLKSHLDLFHMRRKTLASEQAILRENINASGGQIQGLRQQFAAKAEQYALLQQEATAMRPLVEAGYSSRNSLLDLERRISELSSVKTELQTRVAKESSTSAELRLRQLQRQQEFLRDVDQQITETRRELLTIQERLNDARIDLGTKKIRAPVNGQVVALQMHTVGAAITPGAKILEIVPENETLLIDIQVPLQNISSVTVGLMTDVRITSFPGEPQLVIQGVVQSISTDVHEAPPPAPPYYRGRIAITPEGMEHLRGRALRPGMAVDVVIKTGERSLIAYLMRPIMKQLFFALKEQ